MPAYVPTIQPPMSCSSSSPSYFQGEPFLATDVSTSSNSSRLGGTTQPLMTADPSSLFRNPKLDVCVCVCVNNLPFLGLVFVSWHEVGRALAPGLHTCPHHLPPAL